MYIYEISMYPFCKRKKPCIHVYAVPESAQEALAVVLEESFQESSAFVAASQLMDVDDLDVVAAAIIIVERLPDDAAAHAVVGGQLLERRPTKVLLLVAVALLRLCPPERVLRLHLPERLRDGGSPAQAPAARRSQRRRMLMIHD
jgi:hypothetical protein